MVRQKSAVRCIFPVWHRGGDRRMYTVQHGVYNAMLALKQQARAECAACWQINNGCSVGQFERSISPKP